MLNPNPRLCHMFAFCAVGVTILFFAAAYPIAAVEAGQPATYSKSYFGPPWFPWLFYGFAMFSVLPIAVIEATGKAAQWLMWFMACSTPLQVRQIGQGVLFINMWALLLLNTLNAVAYAPESAGVFALIAIMAYGWTFMVMASAYLAVTIWADSADAQAAYTIVQQGPPGGSAPAI